MHIISIRSDIYKLKWIAVVAGDQQLQQQQQQLRRLWCMANGTCNFLSLIGWKTNAEIMISCLFFPTCFRTRIFFFSAVSCIMREYKMTGRYFNIRENDNCTKTLFQDSLANSCAFLRESPKFAHNKTALKILCTFFEIPKKKKCPTTEHGMRLCSYNVEFFTASKQIPIWRSRPQWKKANTNTP